MRVVYGSALFAIAMVACAEKPDEPSPVAPRLVLVAQPLGSDTAGVAGFPLTRPLQLVVLQNGAPAPGVAVGWSVSTGAIAPAASITNGSGIASAEWTLGLVPGVMVATARVVHDGQVTATFRSQAYEPVNAVAVESTNRQVARVATALPERLRVRVANSAGARVGMPVTWSVSGGTIDARTLTDANGFAEARWTMPTQAGPLVAYASVNGYVGGFVAFGATAEAGPVTYVGFEQFPLTPQSANPFATISLSVLARDEFGNAVIGAPIRWEALGPLQITSASSATDAYGRSVARMASLGTAGEAIVNASMPQSTVRASFSLTFLRRTYEVLLLANSGYRFESRQNGSSPAVDTLPVGETMVWRLSPFDYDEHEVASLGAPSLPGGGGRFPYANQSEVRVTFSVPGTYRYHDSFYGGTGTVVVR